MSQTVVDLPSDLLHDTAVVMVVDWVESVRHIERDEAGSIARWRRFVAAARESVEGQHDGRLIKTLGDGLLFEVDNARQGVHAAARLHALAEQANGGHAPSDRLTVRVGLHQAGDSQAEPDERIDAEHLASRISRLAGPGETVVSETVRDQLTDGLDGTVEDLGDCLVPHVDHPVRVYRVAEVALSVDEPARPAQQPRWLPILAVVPFAMRLGTQVDHAIGELLAEALTAHLGCAGQLRMINRLSTTVLRDRPDTLGVLQRQLGADYALGGSYSRDGPRVHLYWELTDLQSQALVASSRMTVVVSDLLDPASDALRALAAEVQTSILRTEMRRVDRQPMPTLDSYTLLLGGIQLLHRSTPRDFERSHQLLSHLVEQHPRAVEPRIWLAKWYALRAVQGLAIDRLGDARTALDCIARALDREPGNSFALAMEGFVHCHLTLDFDTGDARLQQALQINPSETFAHLFRGVVQGLHGQWEGGLASHAAAACTSPLDPARYLFDTIGASLNLGGGRHDDAMAMAQRSLRANRLHAHSWRVMAIAQAETGDLDSARQSLRRVMSLQPDLTVERYLAGRPDDPTRQRFAKALQLAGLPAR